ncbi:hypothetical protein [Pseudanabaena sp. PCC 6802]|uniref:hypothetical protein n=1 Tax=Pseudanabaena sp. PCC 6802 TaxID=118173 RepID=UPI0003469F5F|nr:hypothetical protein [Pseudanabaena sp. PCC 6802]
MKSTIAVLGIVSVSCAALAIAPSTTAQRSNSAAPELVLMMDFDRDAPGLEKIYKTQFDRPVIERQQCPTSPKSERVTKNVFVNFQLERQGKRSTIFEYKIGNNLSTYWVHNISEARYLDPDGSLDFVFYAGDDTSSETVLLLMKPDRVKAVYAGVRDLDRWSRIYDLGVMYQDGKPVSVWHPEREVFVGKGIAWTVGDCVVMRKTPEAKGEVIQSLYAREVVDLVEEPEQMRDRLPSNTSSPLRVRLDLNTTFSSSNVLVTRLQARGVSWQKVSWNGKVGWVDRSDISYTSPTQTFPLK